MTFLLFMLVQSAVPATLTETQQRDIDCVATFGLVAYQQSREAPGFDGFRNLQAAGRTYAGIVGSRLIEETGLSPEVIGAAIASSARAQVSASEDNGNGAGFFRERYSRCEPLLDAEIANADDLPLPVPQR